TATFNFTPAAVNLDNFSALIGKSDIAAHGSITNYLAYALSDSLLTGRFDMSSNLLDLNEFMTDDATAAKPAEGTPAPESTSTMSPIELPGNVDFALNTSINKLIYDKTEIANVKGGVMLRDKVASLRDLVMNVLDGTVMMSGSYNAKNIKQPKMDFIFDISDMDINKAANEF